MDSSDVQLQNQATLGVANQRDKHRQDVQTVVHTPEEETRKPDPIDYLQVDPSMDPYDVWHKWEEKLQKLVAEKSNDEVQPVLQALRERLSKKSIYSNAPDFVKCIDEKVQTGIASVLMQEHWTAGGWTWKYEDALRALDLQEKYKTPLTDKMRESASKKLDGIAEKHPDQACRFARIFQVSGEALHTYVARYFTGPAAQALQAEGLVHVPVDHPDVRTAAKHEIFVAIELYKKYDAPARIKKEFSLSDEEFAEDVRYALLHVLGACRGSLQDIDTCQEQTGVALDWNAPDVIEQAKARAKNHFWIHKELLYELPELKKRVPTCMKGEAEAYVLESFVTSCKHGNSYNKFADAKKHLGVLETIFELPRDKIITALIPLFAEQDIKNSYHSDWYIGLIQNGIIPQELVRERADVAIQELLRETDDRSLKQAVKVRDAFGIAPERYSVLSIDAFHHVLAAGKDDAKLGLRGRELPEGILDDAKTRSAAREGVVKAMQDHGMMYRSINLIEQFGFEEAKSDPDVLTAARKVSNFKIFESKDEVHWEEFLEQCTYFAFTKPSDLKGVYPALDSVIDLWAFSSIPALYDFLLKESALINFLREYKTTPMSLTKEDLPLLKRYRLSLYEAECAKRGGFRFDEGQRAKESSNEKPDAPVPLATALHATCKEWEDEQNIAGPFRRGAERFGNQRMLDYMHREGLSKHDALHAFDRILALQEGSGLTPHEFDRAILRQVHKDSAQYSEGTAHHHLNRIAQTVNPDATTILQRVAGYQNIEQLHELATTFSDPREVFASWKNLQKYAELNHLLGRKELFDQLVELKKDKNKHQLYRFISTLAFHKASKVNMEAVMEFWRDPQTFLSRMDTHTPDEVQNAKKPSNYLQVPLLDLTAEELRDALPEGDLDAMQAFSPLAMRMTMPRDGKFLSIAERLDEALGSKNNDRAPKAKNQKKLFGSVAAALKGICTVQEYIGGRVVPSEIEERIKSLVFDPAIGMPDPGRYTLLVKMNLKSDPEAVLAGDDTACCMPFGSGKKAVYDYNLNTCQFTVQIETEDGRRTVAQSVMTRDRNIERSIPDIIAELKNGQKNLSEILPPSNLARQKGIAAADNVEVALNYKGESFDAILEAVYRRFFQEYMKRFGEEQNFDNAKLVIGKGYSDAMQHLPEEKNTFGPEAPVGYTDKHHDKVYVLDLTKECAEFPCEVLETPQPQKRQQTPIRIRGVQYADYHDTLPMAYLEGKSYDNKALMFFLQKIENILIAKDISNAKKQRPNMSLKYEKDGVLQAYILAYEGAVMDKDIHDTPELQEWKDHKVLYIADLASYVAKKTASIDAANETHETERQGQLAGGRIVKAFLDLYANNYLAKGEMRPIFLQAREQTSYRFFSDGHFQRHLESMRSSLLSEHGVDVSFEMRELPGYDVEDDRMHPIVIVPTLHTEQVAPTDVNQEKAPSIGILSLFNRTRGAVARIMSGIYSRFKK